MTLSLIDISYKVVYKRHKALSLGSIMHKFPSAHSHWSRTFGGFPTYQVFLQQKYTNWQLLRWEQGNDIGAATPGLIWAAIGVGSGIGPESFCKAPRNVTGIRQNIRIKRCFFNQKDVLLLKHIILDNNLTERKKKQKRKSATKAEAP